MDYFDNWDLLPLEVLTILEKYNDLDNDYLNCQNLVNELNLIGWNCQYDLSATPYNLTKINF